MFAIYGTTYGAGDGVLTFNLPDFRNRTIWGSDSFGYIEAGLPNITGIINADGGNEASGAFSIIGNITGNDGEGRGARYEFDASKSNSIYGNADTVRPPAIKVRVVTRYK